jgi:hypothetical protein
MTDRAYPPRQIQTSCFFSLPLAPVHLCLPDPCSLCSGVGRGRQRSLQTQKNSSIARRELEQCSLYRPGVIISQTGTFNDAPGFGTVEVSRRASASPPKPTTNRPALTPDKLVGFKGPSGRTHLFHPNDVDLGRPPLIKLGARWSSYKLVGPFLTHRQRELKVGSLVALSN